MSPCSAPPRLGLSWTLDKQSEQDKVEGRTGGELREKEVYSNEGTALFFLSRCKLTALRGRFSLTGVRTGSYEAALLLSMFVTTALSRSGHTSRATKGPWLPWCHATAVANGVLFISQQQKLTFPKVAASQLPLFLPRGENSKRGLKTTMRQLCQHGRPSPRKHFYNNRRGAMLMLNMPLTHTMRCQITRPAPTLVIPARDSD